MEKIEEAQKLNVQIGDTIEVELNSGGLFTGTFDIHPLANECVKNQHNFPLSYKKIIRKI